MLQFVHDLKIATFRQSKKQTEEGIDGSHVKPAANWPVFDFMNLFLQSKQELATATFELCEDLLADHVVYAEIRFCPTLHMLEGLSETDVVDAVIAGMRQSKIKGGIIICALRTKEPKHSMKMAKLVEQYVGLGVVGFDIAGAETYPLSLHRAALDYLNERQIPMTVHAGEMAVGCLDNIMCAVDARVDRIGHGFAMAFGEGTEHPDVMNAVVQSKIIVECCLTSNLGKIPTYKEHPIREMYHAGVKVSLSSDNALLSSKPDKKLWAKASYELAHLVSACGFSWREARDVLLNAAKGAFVGLQPRPGGGLLGLDAETKLKWCAEYEAMLDEALRDAGVLPP